METPASLYDSIPYPAQRVIRAIAEAQSRYALFPLAGTGADREAVVTVALSGGVDSVCLLHALSLLAPHWNITLSAAHIDHGLRADSAEDAEFSRQLAHTLGVEFHVTRLDERFLAEDSRGVEAAAREARYNALASAAASLSPIAQTPVIATAHHMDDQAETVLMNVIRGSGLRGLGGIRWVRQHKTTSGVTVFLVRPLLGVLRIEIEDYCRAFQLSYRTDYTNTDTSHLRNKIRRETLPYLSELNPQIVETLARTAQLIGPDADRLDGFDRQTLQDLVYDRRSSQSIALDMKQLLGLTLAAQRGVLRQALFELGLDVREVGFDRVEELVWRLAADQPLAGPYTLSENVMWTVLPCTEETQTLLCLHRKGALPLHPRHPHLGARCTEIGLPMSINCPQTYKISDKWALHCSVTAVDSRVEWMRNVNPWRAYLDAECIGSLALTTPAPGDAFTPLGMSGQHKKLGDFFTDRKTPAAFRGEWPIVVDAVTGAILWVCGHTISDHVRITPATRSIVALEWIRITAGDADHTIAPRKARAACAQT